MNLEFSDDQIQIREALSKLLDRHGELEKADRLCQSQAYDFDLHDALATSGFFDIVPNGGSLLDAALVVERVAYHAGTVSAAANAMVYPAMFGEAAPGVVSIGYRDPAKAIRLASFAKLTLLVDGDEAYRLDIQEGDVEFVNVDNTGWPLGRISAAALERAKQIDKDRGGELMRWWRIGLACEAAGTMRRAFDLTRDYVTERTQFGHPIGAFQAIHHRLAYLATSIEGSYWLALESAFWGDDFHAGLASTAAAAAAEQTYREAQQMHGAIGFTREYPLHVLTMRLQSLLREGGGAQHHAMTAARSLFG